LKLDFPASPRAFAGLKTAVTDNIFLLNTSRMRPIFGVYDKPHLFAFADIVCFPGPFYSRSVKVLQHARTVVPDECEAGVK
jgi:hypothetical protein